jgi:hypothetical protein
VTSLYGGGRRRTSWRLQERVGDGSSPPLVPVERGSGKVGEVGVGAVNISVDGRVEEGGEDAEEPELEDTAADVDADADTPSSSFRLLPSLLFRRPPNPPPPPPRPRPRLRRHRMPRPPHSHPKKRGPLSFDPPLPLPPAPPQQAPKTCACTHSWARRSSVSRVRARGDLTRIRAGARTMGEEGKGCWDQRCSCARWGLFCAGLS